MKKIHALPLSVIAISLSLCIYSCNKNKATDSSGKKMDQLHVPANFNWETSKEVSLSVAIDLPSGTGALSRIRVYDGDPLNAGKLMIAGSAGYNFPFVTGLRIPTARKQIFLEMTSPEGNSLVSAVNVQDNIQYTFQPSRAGLKNDLNTLDPDCSSGCDVTISGSGNISITGGKTYCVTGTFTGNISSWTSGTLKVCGTATIPFIKINASGCYIIVTAGGHLTVDSLYMSSTTMLTAYQNAHV